MASVDLHYTCIHKGFETIICRCFQHLPVKSAIFKNKTNACAFCFCLGFPQPFVSDTSPKRIHREGLEESRTGTRQGRFLFDIVKAEEEIIRRSMPSRAGELSDIFTGSVLENNINQSRSMRKVWPAIFLNL